MTVSSSLRCSSHLVLFILISVGASALTAEELTQAAGKAYAEYFERARQAFQDRVNQPLGTDSERTRLRKEEVIVRPGGGDGIVTNPKSLVHHWRGVIFIRGVTLDQVLSVSRAYRDYPQIFGPVVAARVVADQGDLLRVQFRMRQSAAGISATLDVWSSIRYTRISATQADEISISDEIREVKDPGQPTERYLPAGRDSGYLWRAAAFTRFVEADGGVYMEMETIGLSRPFPPLFGWLIEPIARRIGRGSVENSVQEFRRAVLMRHPTAMPHGSGAD